MARIQILELPDDLYDDHSSTPFVLVIDQLTAEQAELLRADTGQIREATGARGVLVFTAPLTIDIPDNHVPVDADGRYAGPAVRVPVQADLDGFRTQVEQAIDEARRRINAVHIEAD